MSPKLKAKSRRKPLKANSVRRNGSKNEARRKERLAIEFELDRQTRQHIGKWVAIADDKIVAVGDDVADVMEAAKRLGYDLPVVVRGPLTADETLYAL